MKSKAPLIAAIVLVVLVIAAVVGFDAMNKAQWESSAKENYGLSSGQKETIDRAKSETAKWDEKQKQTNERMAEIDRSFSEAKSLMDKYNAAPDESKQLIGQIAECVKVSEGEIAALLGPDGKFGKDAEDYMTKLKAERLLEANKELYEYAKGNR